MNLKFAAALLAMLACAGVTAAQTTVPTAPVAPSQLDCSGPEYRAFDFWVGEWDAVEASNNAPAGRSSIKKEDDGCVISEHWIDAETPGYTGHSLNMYDRTTHHWEQFWVDTTGEITHFVGGPFEGGMQLTDPANLVGTRPTQVQTRMTFTPLPDGSVRQHGQASRDNGATWIERYDYIYRRHTGN